MYKCIMRWPAHIVVNNSSTYCLQKDSFVLSLLNSVSEREKE